ncbi:hypothetical protein TCAL_16229 [Tigriopus californicus]|uniref:Dysbindin n=1 Tax=Tigriopus californicus TaxID=6832 RepID=A0A553P1M8_TIGCA|nr:hypothetical protein TCAL_16229 [Tigriopus californicus]
MPFESLSSVRGLSSTSVVEGANAVLDRVAGAAVAVTVPTPSPQYGKKKTVNLDCGSELLEFYQMQWETLHLENEKNAKRAKDTDRSIADLHAQIETQWRNTKTLQSLVGQIPKMNEEIQQIVVSLGELEPLFSKVEIALMALEDTLDARDLQTRQNSRRKDLANFEAQRKAEFRELSARLQREHQSKKKLAEANELVARQQKQRVFQQRFDNDLATFKSGGQLRVPPRHDPDASLETVDLDEEDEENTDLEAFLDDVSPLPRDPTPAESPEGEDKVSMAITLHDSGSSTTPSSKSDLPVISVEPGTSDSGPSRAESMYFTPDTTLEKLAEVSQEGSH